jgi:SAM-dependent methyltransferase
MVEHDQTPPSLRGKGVGGLGPHPPQQMWDPTSYARNARFVAELGMPVLELLAPQRGERILDLGCGDGVLTEKLVSLGCRVTGVDASSAQIAAARARGLNARIADGEALNFDAEFDAVFSNAALHWMKRPDAVLAGVARSLVPGGRFVAECGGQGNIAHIHRALYAALERRGIDPRPLDPWYYPSDAEYRALLVAHGFRVLSIGLFPRPTPLPGDMTAWLETFAGCFIGALPAADRPAFVDEVRRALLPSLCDPAGHWTADYVRLRFAAQLIQIE